MDVDTWQQPAAKFRWRSHMKPIVGTGLAALLITVIPALQDYAESRREARLHDVLRIMRDTIQQHYAARGTYPESLQALVATRYLRAVPKDPIIDRNDSWEVTRVVVNGVSGIRDVHSGSESVDRHGTPYATW